MNVYAVCPATDRRAALSLGIAAAAASVARPAPAGGTAQSTDAKLIRLCAEFDAVERRVKSHYAGGANHIRDDDERDAIIDPFCRQQERLLALLVEARATTLDGLRARAATLALFAPDVARPDANDDLPGQMIAAILRDLTGGVA